MASESRSSLCKRGGVRQKREADYCTELEKYLILAYFSIAAFKKGKRRASAEKLAPVSSCEDAFLSRGCGSAWPSARAGAGPAVTALALGSGPPGARGTPSEGLGSLGIPPLGTGCVCNSAQDGKSRRKTTRERCSVEFLWYHSLVSLLNRCVTAGRRSPVCAASHRPSRPARGAAPEGVAQGELQPLALAGGAGAHQLRVLPLQGGSCR